MKRKLLKYRNFLKPLITFSLLVFLLYCIFRYIPPLRDFAQKNNFTPQFFSSFVFDKEFPIKNYKGRTNIAILGVGGGIHEGADLTDTIIFLSIDLTKKDAAMISLPRDIWLPTLKDKINSAYHYGEKKQPGGGFILAKAAIEEVIGQPVHYVILINFSGFKDLIDLIGGIDLNVEKEFTDQSYPIEGKENDFCAGDPSFACRYEALHFSAGWQHMDGAFALKYVRSRYAQDNEGTDFARSKRQQQVIMAVKEKLKQTSVWKNYGLIKKLYYSVNQIIQTDLVISEKILLVKYFLTSPADNLRKIILDSGDDKQNRKGLLRNPSEWEYNGLWVLVPREGSFEEIHQYVVCKLEDLKCPITP